MSALPSKEYENISFEKCKGLDKISNLRKAMKFIANEEKLAYYPEKYRKQAIQIEKFAKTNNIQIEFDGTDLYILTDIAAWKIAYSYHYDYYKLLHCPFNIKKLNMKEAKNANYHVQSDVQRKQTPYKHLQYIVKHDIAKKIERIDYRKLPKKTEMQRKYYRQAENRYRKKSIRRVFDIFAELEAKSERVN